MLVTSQALHKVRKGTAEYMMNLQTTARKLGRGSAHDTLSTLYL